MAYAEDVVSQLWEYKRQRFGPDDSVFEESDRRGMRPPVFRRGQEVYNILVAPTLTPVQREVVLGAIGQDARHRWFRSMKSSQALVQSVFGHLKALSKLHLLATLVSEDGLRPFAQASANGCEVTLEHAVDFLGERRRTSVDVFLECRHPVAVECKFAEADVGHCSRPELANDNTEHCNGNYELQYGRSVPCVLTELKIRYWDFIPRLFKWEATGKAVPCPMRRTYQLVRNVLAASVAPDGTDTSGCAVLLYDDRNPAFGDSGSGYAAYVETKQALREQARLTRLTWQSLLESLRQERSLAWLLKEVHLKYGL